MRVARDPQTMFKRELGPRLIAVTGLVQLLCGAVGACAGVRVAQKGQLNCLPLRVALS
jgi:hypothetical protein